MAVGMEGKYRNRTRITLYHRDRRATHRPQTQGGMKGKNEVIYAAGNKSQYSHSNKCLAFYECLLNINYCYLPLPKIS